MYFKRNYFTPVKFNKNYLLNLKNVVDTKTKCY